MKKFIALMAIASASSVFATENVEFGDLNFFVKQGQANARADINHSSLDRKFSPSTGRGTKVEKEGYTVETAIGYGVMDDLNVYLGLGYDFGMEIAQMRQSQTASDSRYNQDGLRDPSLAANYRLLKQTESIVNLDFGAVARYSLEDREDGASFGKNTKDGNAASGRTSYELNTAVGRKWNEANEWRLSAGIIHFTEGDRDQANIGSGTTNYDVDSSQDIYIRAAYQYRPVQEFMMALALTGTQVGEVEEEASGSTTTYDAHMSYDLSFTAKYLITETFIGKFAMNIGNNPNYDYEVGNTQNEVRNIRTSSYTLGVDFLF